MDHISVLTFVLCFVFVFGPFPSLSRRMLDSLPLFIHIRTIVLYLPCFLLTVCTFFSFLRLHAVHTFYVLSHPYSLPSLPARTPPEPATLL